jgi:hypothetical protein
MVLEVLDKAHESEAGSEEPNAIVDIFEEAEQRSEAENTEIKQWSYSMPFPGVRYYWY